MRSKLNAFLLILLLGAAGCMSPKLITQNATQATEEILNKQVLSWNKGDLNGFMEGYWKSDTDLAYVTGKWKLDRSAGNLDGYFTLLLRRMPEGWRIISDHSS